MWRVAAPHVSAAFHSRVAALDCVSPPHISVSVPATPRALAPVLGLTHTCRARPSDARLPRAPGHARVPLAGHPLPPPARHAGVRARGEGIPLRAMARGIRKPVLASLRTRFVVFTLLLAMSEANAMPSNLFHVPSVPQVQSICVLWMVSYKALAILSSRRYLAAARRTGYKCADWYTNVLLRSAEDKYRSYMRMSRTTFAYVLSMLRAHAGDVFKSRRGTTQIRLAIQLSIVLFRFGLYGNGSRVHFVADVFGVSSGTVVKSTERVMKGLKRLAPSVIRRPNTQRRAQQAEWAGSSYGFDNCIGATDGTTSPLAYQPALHPWSYYDSKGRYRLNSHHM